MLLRPLLLSTLLLAACDPRPAGVVVDEVHMARQADGRWACDVDVIGVESSGRDVGRYCVSLHFFSPGADLSLQPPKGSYGGELDQVAACFDGGLRDGDSRRVHLVTKSDGIPTGATVRAQASVGRHIDAKDTSTP